MIYVIGAINFPRKANRHSRQCEVAPPGIKPEHMITNMLRKINIKSDTHKAKSKSYRFDMYAGWKEQRDSAV